jgi:MFS transporter, FHS family, L-fucose permease
VRAAPIPTGRHRQTQLRSAIAGTTIAPNLGGLPILLAASLAVEQVGRVNGGGFSASSAAGRVSFYRGGAMIGRFPGAAVLRRVKAGSAGSMRGRCGNAGDCLHVAWRTHGDVDYSRRGILQFDRSVDGRESGILITAIEGGAILPLIQSAIADHFGLHHAFILPLLKLLFVHLVLRSERIEAQ